MIREALAKLVDGRDLTMDEAAAAMSEIMEGTATPAQVGAFLVALRLKGETTEEIAGMAAVMREKAQRVVTNLAPVDTCGTGGDGSHTFNISTTAAFVVAGAGQPVAKHGNRAMSSACGSADVLEALGANIALGPEQAAECLHETGVAFMFAQLYHPAMKYVAPVRREIGVRTVFNVLGPLTNPAGAPYQVIGVAVPPLMRRMAEALGRLGSRRALVVHGAGGLDELSLAGPNMVQEWTGSEVREYVLHPEELGLRPAPRDAVKGGSAQENAALLRAVLSGEPGPRRDIVLLNAGAALYACGKASSLKEGIEMAVESIDSSAAMRRLERFVAMTQRLNGQEAKT
jgi:anthranilate phosphoribosyltransferase